MAMSKTRFLLSLVVLNGLGLWLSSSPSWAQSAGSDNTPATTTKKALEPMATQREAISSTSSNTSPLVALSNTDNQSAPLKDACRQIVKEVSRTKQVSSLMPFCEFPKQLSNCQSEEGRPIFHSESISQDSRGKRILVLGLIHGDEPLAGELPLAWSERLKDLKNPRNSWRIVPLLNPDGLMRKTRNNANGVDLNRNFPTKDWEQSALDYWKKSARSDKRRFPGNSAASEEETKCVISHIRDFHPDFIVSVHTPYRVLDFDGPKMRFPKYSQLPWKALGNYPGSLGRYMWKDANVPVLTIELGVQMVDAEELQDLIGKFAIDAIQETAQKTASRIEPIKASVSSGSLDN